MTNRRAIAWFALGIFVVLGSVAALNFDGSLFEALTEDESAASTTAKKADAGKRSEVSESARKAAPAALSGATFDAARIESDGTAVFAGRAEPGAVVTVLANGQVVATTKADSGGEWAIITSHKLAAGEYQLSLRTETPGAANTQGQALRVTVAAPPPAAAVTGTAVASARPAVIQPSQKSDPRTATASAVTSSMMTNLQGLVASARSGAPAEPISVPLPITFVYGEPVMTSEGHTAAKLLAEFIRLRRLDSLTLSGHADERGTDDFNMELSRQRLLAIRNFLVGNGYKGQVVLIPKGKSEPFAGIDRRAVPRETAYQLDRRVELHLNQ